MLNVIGHPPLTNAPLKVIPDTNVELDVFAVTFKLPPEVQTIVVLAWLLRVIPTLLGMVTCDDQVQVPPGINTVSPEDAELIADCTSEAEQVLAVIVFARAPAAQKTLKIKTNKMYRATLAIS